MFDELWSEIQDAPGEIFDVIEYKEEWEQDDKFDVESTSKVTPIIDVFRINFHLFQNEH